MKQTNGTNKGNTPRKQTNDKYNGNKQHKQIQAKYNGEQSQATSMKNTNDTNNGKQWK